MDAAEKFWPWAIPELGENLISLLDPSSTLAFLYSGLMDKKTLQKSLTSKAWGALLRNSSVQRLVIKRKIMEDVKILVKILLFAEFKDPVPHLMPLLDLICESCPGNKMEMICPCCPEPHSISFEGFQLLEVVESTFSTTEQSLKSTPNIGYYYSEILLSSISSRMSRQKEKVSSIWTLGVHIKDKSSLEAFITLLQAESVRVDILEVCTGELGKEDWQTLAGALMGKPEVKVRRVWLSRQDLRDVRESIQEIWYAAEDGIRIGNIRMYVEIDKPDYDWEQAWERVNQLTDMTEDQFKMECESDWATDEDTDSEGEYTEIEMEEESGEDT